MEIRDVGAIFLSLSRARFSDKRQWKWTLKAVTVIVKTNRQQFSMVCTLIDHRSYVIMFTTVQ